LNSGLWFLRFLFIGVGCLPLRFRAQSNSTGGSVSSDHLCLMIARLIGLDSNEEIVELDETDACKVLFAELDELKDFWILTGNLRNPRRVWVENIRFATMPNGIFNLAYMDGYDLHRPFSVHPSANWPAPPPSSYEGTPIQLPCDDFNSPYAIGPVCWDDFVSCRDLVTGLYECKPYTIQDGCVCDCPNGCEGTNPGSCTQYTHYGCYNHRCPTGQICDNPGVPEINPECECQ